jgi:hypothetical protein
VGGVELHVPEGFSAKRDEVVGFDSVSDSWAQSRWDNGDEEEKIDTSVSMEDLELEDGGFQ